MIAVKPKGMATRDHRLELTIPASIPPGEVEIIVLHPEPHPRPRVRGRQHPPTVPILPPAYGRIVRSAWGRGKTLEEIDAEIDQMRAEWDRDARRA